MGGIFSTIDLFSQKIKFTYNKRENFPTVCGGIMTIIMSALILLYFIYLVVYTVEKRFPTIIEGIEVFDVSPLFKLDSDTEMKYYNGDKFLYDDLEVFENTTILKNVDKEFPRRFQLKYPTIPDNEINKTFFFQFSIGFLLKEENFIDLDAKLMTMDADYVYYNKIEDFENRTSLYYTKCKRFYKFDKEEIEYLNIAKTYCVYDTFFLEKGDLTNSSRRIEINIRKCRNTTENDYSCYDITKIDTMLDNMKVYLFYTDYQFDISDNSNALKVNLANQNFEFMCKFSKTINYSLSPDLLYSHDSLMPESIDTFYSQFYAPNFKEPFEQFEKYSDNEGTIFKFNIRAHNIRNVNTRKFPSWLDVLGISGGMSRIIYLVATVLVIYIVKMNHRESMVNDFYSLVDPKNNKFIKRSFADFLMGRLYHFDMIKIDNDTYKRLLDIYDDDDFDNGVNTFFNKDKINYIYGLFLIVAEKSFGNIFDYTDFNFNIRIGEDKDDFVNIKDTDYTACFKEIKKFQIIYEISKTTSYDKMYFNFFEFLGLIFLCDCCKTKNFKRKTRIFNKACQKLKEDVDFISIIKSTKEISIFKSIFLNDNQQKLFQFVSKKPITIEDTYTNKPKNTRRSVLSTLKTFKGKLDNDEDEDEDDPDLQKLKEDEEDYAKFVELEDVLSKISEKQEYSYNNHKLLSDLNIEFPDIKDFIWEKEFSAKNNLNKYEDVFQLIINYHHYLMTKKQEDKSVISNRSEYKSLKNVDIEMTILKPLNFNQQEVKPNVVSLNFLNERELQEKINKKFMN